MAEDRSEPLYQPRFKCPVCGTFRLAERVAQELYEIVYYHGGGGRPLIPEDHHLWSAVIRDRYERSGRRDVFLANFDELRTAAVPLDDPFDAVDRILLYVMRTAPRVGEEVHLNPETDYPIAFARDARELKNYVELGTRIGFLEAHGDVLVRPTPEGWVRLKELRFREVESDVAFVAMSFAEGMEDVFRNGFEPALRSTGFRAIRLDLIEHNEKIGDRMIADIRKSSLVVADFTLHRQNVYFEAGFALGLGRHLIWTCRESDIEQAHFDTRHYNHVVWRDAADLEQRLRNRIEATVPIPRLHARA
ncbi:MAG TPA: hypothetical protein VFS20_17190 [Longimicrobium sp.]|nr:hypothetical protein [Longimicrobium sp.]